MIKLYHSSLTVASYDDIMSCWIVSRLIICVNFLLFIGCLI
ncbi:hypothetical protein PL9214430215 [Planktothrix tepida PCC 9214]|uniref:Uncharacterized protein n=1 Tax=Planktothrix tepida PCC 9214 TaxID=671072 RepID=A0A1J1LIC6_9CYAN|nr:hypothetical protein PL9214430215 [Planktothrix tepida PCC 9214]